MAANVSFFPMTANALFSLAFIIYCQERLRFGWLFRPCRAFRNLSYKPYTDNAAGKVNIIPFQGKRVRSGPMRAPV